MVEGRYGCGLEGPVAMLNIEDMVVALRVLWLCIT